MTWIGSQLHTLSVQQTKTKLSEFISWKWIGRQTGSHDTLLKSWNTGGWGRDLVPVRVSKKQTIKRTEEKKSRNSIIRQNNIASYLLETMSWRGLANSLHFVDDPYYCCYLTRFIHNCNITAITVCSTYI